MKPSLALCAHLGAAPRERAPAAPQLELPAEWIFEWLGGPVRAAAACSECGAVALLELLDWSATHDTRIYTAAALERASLELVLRDLSRGSCDLARRDAEIDALLACAGPVELLLAYELRSGRVIATADRPAGFRAPGEVFVQRIPEPSELRWFEQLGLDKGAAA